MAEQDKYSSYFSTTAPNPANPKNRSVQLGVPDLSGRAALGAEQERYGGHFTLPDSALPNNILNGTATVGILQSTILPNLGFQTGLGIVAYGASRASNRVEVKDLVFPAGQVVNAWWCALGTKIIHNNLTLSAALSTLSYPEKLLLSGVTAWGSLSLYRSLARKTSKNDDDDDDSRYAVQKTQAGFWNQRAPLLFAIETAAQTLVSLPFTLPFRDVHNSALGALPIYHASMWHSIAVGVFGAGVALDVVRDAGRRQQQQTQGARRSVGEIPSSLGDVLIHASFPILLYSCGILHPLALVGPVAEYVYLKYMGPERDEGVDAKGTGKRFWPTVEDVKEPWLWGIVGAGIGAAMVEGVVREMF